MVCRLPAPHWTSSLQKGLISAVENVADGYIIVNAGTILPVYPADEAYYVIYFSSDLNTLWDEPKLIATAQTVSIPPTLVSLNQYIGVHAAQMGLAADLSTLEYVNTDLYLYPSPTTLAEPLGISDTHVVVYDATSWPAVDGYVKIEDEVILYSSIVDGYDGYVGLVISDRDPFGCNTIASHLDGYAASVFIGFETLNDTAFKPKGSCSLPLPEWVDWNRQGIYRVEDSGIGTSLKIQWYEAYPPTGFSRVYYNIYQSDSLYELGSTRPTGFSVSADLEAIIQNLSPGKNYYFRIKASYQLANLDLVGFTQAGTDYYLYPDPVTLEQDDGYWYENSLGTMKVSSTTGYPDEGFLHIGSEILQYSEKTSTTFNIVARDVFSIDYVDVYSNGTQIQFFNGVQDANRNYYRLAPSWDAGLDVPLLPIPDDGYAYNQDQDGYRNFATDLNTEDHSNFEETNSDFASYPYCGYRAPNYVNLFKGQQCGTYSGGRSYQVIPGVNNGNPVLVTQGMNVTTAAQNREELLLGLTGEFFVLLRRKWTGKKCARLSIRSEHPHARCGTCYGTTFDGGYDRYVNSRSLRPGEANTNGFIAMRVEPYQNDLELTAERGLAQVDTITAWTTSIPVIKDRDILIRYIYDQEQGIYMQEYRYEVLNVNRNKLLFGDDGKQQISMKKLDKTHEVYKFPAGGPSLLELTE